MMVLRAFLTLPVGILGGVLVRMLAANVLHVGAAAEMAGIGSDGPGMEPGQHAEHHQPFEKQPHCRAQTPRAPL